MKTPKLNSTKWANRHRNVSGKSRNPQRASRTALGGVLLLKTDILLHTNKGLLSPKVVKVRDRV